ncbi:sulfite exporter TauE/SafE family protein [Pectobacteriaceae bacterium CE70]|nr:sulfite exporter TauE/SafE family protein [Prodigiosinella sp. LS101]WJV58425.1 sulfite exporter TauE/SafE family protein [Pectobacteriaceae bacterium C111]WJV62715.1 sulfite exporter TauE/SafE family protein [Pectobacteriaceae bacterium C52]WJV67048.1 sulfite exporter TauE/SafE family protein [Pectobacteriaceae bacterium CE70]WJY11032.1 sulfite exporter TauE/SafE family protein [Pectobacteriaceae bacterium C80]WJY14924.1 sulfite exporter TauE/SafE family protein [Pectobacteriaceae bacteriu
MGMEWILAYLALGAVVGFMAGLLGIGGGGIMVPILTALFAIQGVQETHLVHMALGTSMAAIVVTAISSLRTHHQYQAVLWPVVWRITPAILIGTFTATWLAALLPTQVLAIFFSCFMAYVALQMVLNIKPKPNRQLPGMAGISLAGLSIGGISALVAIGGGSLTVPFLTWCNVRIQQAIGTSAAVGLPIALSGALGYMINGWSASGLPAYSLGYVSLPAVVLISAVSFFTAPVGARLAHRLPVATLRKVFAGLLVLLSLKMLQTVFSG